MVHRRSGFRNKDHLAIPLSNSVEIRDRQQIQCIEDKEKSGATNAAHAAQAKNLRNAMVVEIETLLHAAI
ncbi:hypothetical protein LOE09_15415 [Pseudosulfitobacter pseudonitzschiae]|nr:hypothetical protein [Pseudosulfitobacter pseudonitzschiae]MCI2215256.1 hypothetical protein [Pseudosulfitobacter pseudonitzschiae]UFE29511.1 hypothetical protein LOE41_04115 [Pseudosulfitobacter pseudonitzschiae]UFE39159.1 hypothetical protein LOE39_06215 [Pseudosulfitobacter pseudonitzschiae]UFE43683.1 hypothetical protein LOE38_06205 [Pseudosulfitobacter pseudonitzschiae]UFE62569.1 hypothetical protein LOE28_06205 [Pseudosulfitobacter pseudonitzschiae]